MFKKISKLIELKLIETTRQIEILDKQKLKWSAREKWDLETGKKFNDLVSFYPISEDELLDISKTVCEFVKLTRVTNIEQYLFLDKENEIVRLPYMLKKYKEIK